MKEILYIGGFELPDKNAAAQRVLANAKLLRDMGFIVSFIGISKEVGALHNVYDGFCCESLPYPTNAREWFKHISTFVTKGTVAKYHPDIVVLYNFPALAGLRVLRFCHQHGVRVIHDTTEWELPEGRSLHDLFKFVDTQLRMKFCIKKMDGVIAISRYLYDYYRSEKRAILIPPMVDLDDPKWNRNRVLTAHETVKIVYAGSPGAKTKDRLDRIVEAVLRTTNIEFIIVGLSRQQYIEQFGDFPEDRGSITFKGRIPHKEAVKTVCEADFQVLIREDTLKNRAGFPTKFVESISCCTPVIATLTSNISDYLIDGKNGYVVNETNTLEKVLTKVSNLSADQRIAMKRFCRDNNAFDYHNYKHDFTDLFSV